MNEEDQHFIPHVKDIKHVRKRQNLGRLNFLCNSLAALLFFSLIALLVLVLIQHQIETGHLSIKSLEFLQKKQFHTPLIDKNEYKLTTLPNGIKLLLITNPSAEISQVALSVRAGSFQEPDSYPGLAHLLEHMLFEGSSAYPELGHFTKFISSNGGDTNAYTSDMETNYFFKVGSSALDEALNIFSQFFLEPTLAQQMIEKEVQAVHNEWEIAKASDWFKVEGLLRTLSAQHPYEHFNFGNKDTLLKPEIQRELRAFFQNFYSANLMSLVVESNLPLTSLEQMVDRFAKIQNERLVQPSCQEFGMPIKERPKLGKFKQNSDSKLVLFVHQVDDSSKYYKGKSLIFLKQLVNSRASNGLFDYLKQRNLALDLEASIESEDGNGCFSFFIIQIIVNDTKAYLQIGQAIQSYFRSLFDTFFEDQGDFMSDSTELRRVWHEFHLQSELKFKFLENPTRDIAEIARNLNLYEMEDVLSGNILYQRYEPENIYGYLANVMDLENMVILIGDPDFKGNQRRPLYNLEFTTADISDSDLNQLAASYQRTQDMRVPQKNEYLPHNLQLKSICQVNERSANGVGRQSNPYLPEEFIQVRRYSEMVFPSVEDCIRHEYEYEVKYPYPEFIIKNAVGKLWWKLDRSYENPSIFMGIKFDKFRFHHQLKTHVMLKVLEELARETVEWKLNQALEVGYKARFEQQMNFFSLTLYGWSDGFSRASEAFLASLVKTSEQEQRLFQLAVKSLSLELAEIREARLTQQLMDHYLPYVMNYQYQHPTHMLEALKKLSYSEFSDFKSEIFSELHFTLYLQGNILRTEAIDHFKQISGCFNSKPFIKVLKLSKDYIVPFASQSSDQQDENGAVLNYYTFGPRSRKLYAIMSLLKGAFDSQAFIKLRTEKQLGYVVRAGFRPLDCVDGAFITVQGSKKTPYEVNQDIEDFLRAFAKYIADLSSEELDNLKRGAISILVQKEKSLYQSAESFWQHIKDNDFVFEEKEITIDQIELITKGDLDEFMNKTFRSAQKISLQLYGKGMLKRILKSDQKLTDYLESQPPVKNFGNREETVTEVSKVRIGAYLYQCTNRLSSI